MISITIKFCLCTNLVKSANDSVLCDMALHCCLTLEVKKIAWFSVIQ